jgi:ATP-dependent DNA helicase RecG
LQAVPAAACALLAVLPFQLTAAQRGWAEIALDLARPVPMHRLLQGDVGSGKTVVAALAAAICIDAGWQCALMAPTEILAEQHFRKLIGWLEPLGITTAWLTGSQKTKERREMLALIESGEAALVVGTHAVIQDKVQFSNLALAIIDEQHRFGVAQRLALREDGDRGPGAPPADDDCHADPAHAGHELLRRPGRLHDRRAAAGAHAHRDQGGQRPRRDEVIERIRAQLAQGRQVYWVCPLIEESEALDLTNATATHAELSAALAGGVMVGLLHSRMPVAEKKAVMVAVSGRADGRAGQHHRDRGGRGRAQRLADGDRACRALRPVAAAPAARAGGARCGRVGLRAAVLHGRRARGWVKRP